MSVLDAFNVSVDNAIERGYITEIEHGAIIEAARKVAIVMDEPEWPIVRGKIDNVSPSVFLKYCDALKICPDVEVKKDQRKQKAKIASFTSSSKFAKAANG